jgi:hypothetical protein
LSRPKQAETLGKRDGPGERDEAPDPSAGNHTVAAK